jgi:hypothetical protein
LRRYIQAPTDAGNVTEAERRKLKRTNPVLKVLKYAPLSVESAWFQPLKLDFYEK